jgi:type II secretory pathway predicted ATPase ExeA
MTRRAPARKQAHQKSALGSAYRYFGLKHEPFSTLALQPHNLGFFVGRTATAERLSAALHALHNVGVAGMPGTGKSSLLQVVRKGISRDFHVVSIGVPVDDAAYFLRELLRELLLNLPPDKKLPLKAWSRRLEEEKLSKNAVLSMVKARVARLKKPLLVFADDLEKIQGDRVTHLTRFERTLQVLEELKPVFELPNVAFAVSLQDEFHAKIRDVVKDGADPTVLGLFKNVIRVEPFPPSELRHLVEVRLSGAGWKGGSDLFFESEAMILALAFARGNPRRLMYLLSEATDRAFLRRGKRVEFKDLFETVNEHLRLDLVCKKLLYFLAKSGRAMAANKDLQGFMGLDAVSINRRFDILSRNGLVDKVDVAEGSFVYALSGMDPTGEDAETAREAPDSSLGRFTPFKDEKMWELDPKP